MEKRGIVPYWRGTKIGLARTQDSGNKGARAWRAVSVGPVTMQFHEYRTIRNQFLAVDDKEYPEAKRVRAQLKQLSSAELRAAWIADLARFDELSELDASTAMVALGEDIWVDEQRPYYNCWPIAAELSRNVNLTLPFASCGIPFPAMVLRFAKGHEPLDVRFAMLLWPKNQHTVMVVSYVGADLHRLLLRYVFNEGQQLQAWLDAMLEEEAAREPSMNQHRIGEMLIRLSVFVSLLTNDEDLVTPIVLAKDRAKYESTSDQEIRRWLEDRAARRAGRGFDVGKKLQVAKDTSPHWRNPHLCLFWTGESRVKPVIKMRSGAIVQTVSMAEVPTGYLGPECEDEDVFGPDKTPRDSISKRRRFAIMQRDGFRCQLCGVSAENQAILHVDHRNPLANGGSNEDDNLWTLCDRCNLGKSDSLLGEPDA